MRIAGKLKHSMVNGPGVRYTVFFQGCKHQCAGCHNPETHNPKAGEAITEDEILEEILGDKYIDGVTLSGGDPFFQLDALSYLSQNISEHKVDVWVYTGFTFEELCSDDACRDILPYIDVLVDGRFEMALKSDDCIFRGSSNQRLIDVKRSLSEENIIEYEV